MSSSSSREEGEVHDELSFEEAQQQGQPVEQQNIEEEQLAGNLMRFEATESSKGKIMLRANGFEYVFEADSKEMDGVEYWHCRNRPPYCPARLHVQQAWIQEGNKRFKLGKVVGKAHNHAPKAESIRDGQLMMKAQSQAENPVPARIAVGQARQQMDPEVRAQEATSTSSMSRTYRRYVHEAKKEIGDDQIDNDENPTISERYQEIILFEGEIDGNLAWIFCSEFGLRIIQRYGSTISVDGTFKSCPGGFTQLYTINVIIDSCSVPAIYALLRSKTRPTYEQLFVKVRERIPIWAPTSVIVDFEMGAIEAIREISGCLFHFAQCCYRQLQKLPGLNALFLAAEQEPHNTRIKVKCLISLAFVPVPFVYNYFCLLIHQFEGNNEVRKLAHYFAKNWIGCNKIWATNPLPIEDDDGLGNYGQVDHALRDWILQKNFQQRRATFRPEFWNVCERLEENQCRTNNSTEAWHRIFNAYFRSGRHPLRSEFLRAIVKEDNHWSTVVEDFKNAPANGIRGKSQKRKAEYIEQDENLQLIFNDRGNRDPFEYLRAVAYRMPDPI